MLRQVTVKFHQLEGKHYQWVRRKRPSTWTRPTHLVFQKPDGAIRTQQPSPDAERIIRARQGFPQWLNWPHWTAK